MATGQMTATGCEGGLLSGQAFRADAAVGWLAGELASSWNQRFPGLRVALDMSWALRPVAGIEELPEFEEGIAAALEGSTAAVLCQYDRERFDPVTLASVAGFHTRAVAAATYYATRCYGSAASTRRRASGSPGSWTSRPRSRSG
jgi:hypothetical protein